MKKLLAIIIGISVLGTGVYVSADDNPYSETSSEFVYEMTEGKVHLKKDKLEIRFKKWEGEIDLGVTYSKVKKSGSKKVLSNKIEWKDTDEEVHAYPLEDGKFEIEIYLKKKPQTNTFEFDLDGYEDLNFFYQPALTQTEIDDGAFRPENVIGSYAVYHKTKKNHIMGQTNYMTGKAYHIYRPKAIDDNGVEEWALLNYSNGKLTVTVPQDFLDNAKYPVLVDPTFGETGTGDTTSYTPIQNTMIGAMFTSPANGTVDSISWNGGDGVGGGNFKASIVLHSNLNILTNGIGNSVAMQFDNSHPFPWQTSTYTTSPEISSGTAYVIMMVNDSFAYYIRYDTGATDQGHYDSTNSYSSPTNPTDATNTTNIYSIYATYTADAPSEVRSTPIINNGSIILNAGSFINN